MTTRSEEERDAAKVTDDRRHLINLDFEPFDDTDGADDGLMFEPGDIPA